ncbi:MAG: TfoX/Sxy family protein [Gemmatimonadaceae bacterium]|jgi:TfoX/Sxy family transcriptional regulator of competence genes
MATDAGYAKYVCDQLQAAGGISARKMFGEYGLYRYGKIVALICDNQLFVKPTPAGEAVLGTPTYGPPYPGAKPFFNVSDLLDDPEWLVRLIEATDAALPAPRKKPERQAAAESKGGARPMTERPVKKAAPKKAVPKKAVPRKPAVRTAAKKPATKK